MILTIGCKDVNLDKNVKRKLLWEQAELDRKEN